MLLSPPHHDHLGYSRHLVEFHVLGADLDLGFQVSGRKNRKAIV